MSGLIVHEWLEKHGGAESVVEQFGELYPAAPIFCLWDDFPERFRDRRVRESWLGATPLRKSKPLALPFMLPTWRRIPATEVEWVLCSSHLFAHHARLSNHDSSVRKYVYAHTPARYIWSPELDKRGQGFHAKAAASLLRGIDRKRAGEATAIAANSEFVKARIEATWGQEASVIFPPVDVAYFAEDGAESRLSDADLLTVDALPSQFILGASRFVPYKGLDKVIEAGEAADIPVVLAGDGPEFESLRQRAEAARVPVHVLRAPSRPLLRALYKRAAVYVFPAIEDFGIMPVEAMASGTPVIANRRGGAGESVEHGRSGILLDDFSASSLRAAVGDALVLSSDAARTRAESFDQKVFRRRIAEWMN
ncbi:glycosyltransferase [Paenarthrobacter sp. AB444]|uniref:glycosyltransferase n=1 Tax=Paenarthrobacter sp. AB444 TaxID=3025681 RepID=UPI0023654D81|nr:glycosyltransferase [Paenarthrobacter sp. AB444]MDD7835645.1 glycosyltransferase [Paenarthrobacter sp. AB444]